MSSNEMPELGDFSNPKIVLSLASMTPEQITTAFGEWPQDKKDKMDELLAKVDEQIQSNLDQREKWANILSIAQIAMRTVNAIITLS